MLRRIARTLCATAPAGALVARLGGEEFAVLTDDAIDLPDTILCAIRATRMPFDIPVTVSVGVESGAIVTEEDWSRLYRAADQALFAAKDAGRDRARCAA